MLEAAAAFGGGVLIQQSFEGVKLPKLTRADDGAPAFKLSARVLGASALGIQAPGIFSRQRPYLEVNSGKTQKVTELADYESATSTREVGAGAKDCPWRFSDTLTFVVKLEDVLGPGLKLRLRTRSDITIGPLQVELRAREVGEATLSLRQRILPACVQERRTDAGRASSWASPLMLVGLSHMKGGIGGGEGALGEAVAHVTLLFSTDIDPEAILNAVDASTRSIPKKIEEKADDVMRWLNQALDLSWLDKQFEAKLGAEEPVDTNAAVRRAAMRAWSVSDVDTPLKDPDLSPDGWVSARGPNGRKYWHNLALGPPPWEADEAAVKAPRTQSLPCPEECPDGWISHRGESGRMFWHNKELGPAPWERQHGPRRAAAPPAVGALDLQVHSTEGLGSEGRLAPVSRQVAHNGHSVIRPSRKSCPPRPHADDSVYAI